jgi:hypothetical protein
MRVALLPTGKMELAGLPPALKSIFPTHDFYAICMRPQDNEPFDGFTSSRVAPDAPNGNLDKIVEQMAAELVPGRGGDAPHLLIVVDDLEVVNRDQPAAVVAAFRRATVRHVEGLRLQERNPRLANEVRDALLAKASFHLAVPMVEAWLFADPGAPRNAGVPPERLPPSWEAARDPEDFATQDPVYLADDCSACTVWRALQPPKKQKDHNPFWHNKEHRDVHPKAFLAWLCRDPEKKSCSRYRETHEGANALRNLDWTAALRNPEHCTYLRAMVEDLADGLGERPAFPLDGHASPLTSHRERRDPQVLRNI